MTALPPPSVIDERGRDRVLDFWRGVSVLMVVSYHLVYFHYAFFRTAVALSSIADRLLVGFVYRAGPMGVRIFFVISGYIITTLMLKEEARTGRFNMRTFYFRRICRILPPFYFYIVMTSLFGLLGWIVTDFSQLTAAAFLCNTNMPCGWNVVHTWTLAIEEQFYIFWPILFVLIPAAYRARFVGLLLCILIALSTSGIFITRGWIDNPISFACIAIGALYALSEPFQQFVKRRGVLTAAALALVIAVVAYLPLSGASEFAHLLFREATPFFLLVVIVASYSFHWLIRTRLFAYTAQLGLISYSLYLWQQVFGAPADNYPVPSLLQHPILMLVFALFSYLVIERPAISWSKRYIANTPWFQRVSRERS